MYPPSIISHRPLPTKCLAGPHNLWVSQRLTCSLAPKVKIKHSPFGKPLKNYICSVSKAWAPNSVWICEASVLFMQKAQFLDETQSVGRLWISILCHIHWTTTNPQAFDCIFQYFDHWSFMPCSVTRHTSVKAAVLHIHLLIPTFILIHTKSLFSCIF